MKTELRCFRAAARPLRFEPLASHSNPLQPSHPSHPTLCLLPAGDPAATTAILRTPRQITTRPPYEPALLVDNLQPITSLQPRLPASLPSRRPFTIC